MTDPGAEPVRNTPYRVTVRTGVRVCAHRPQFTLANGACKHAPYASSLLQLKRIMHCLHRQFHVSAVDQDRYLVFGQGLLQRLVQLRYAASGFG